MTTTTAPAQPHAFESAGLGKAPFRYVGFYRAVFQASPDAPVQCGTSCDFCGAGLCNAFRVESSDGKSFKVGCNCVMRCDPALLAEHIAAIRAQRKADRDAYLASGARERAAAREAERKAQALANVTALAMVIAGLEIVLAWAGLDRWTRDLLSHAQERIASGDSAGLTGLEWDRLALAYPAAELPASQHFGTVGARLRGIRARFEGGPVIGLDSMYGPSLLAKFRTERGEVIVWKTSNYRTICAACKCTTCSCRTSARIPCVERGAHGHAKPGEWVQLTGTVKAHDQYEGVAQTVLTRCKVA